MAIQPKQHRAILSVRIEMHVDALRKSIADDEELGVTAIYFDAG